MVEKYTRRVGGSILDVGCGTGIFLNEMRSAGWMVRGVEPSSFAVSYARKIFDLDIYQGVLEKTNFQMKTFDVITLWDVLEHTQSPSSTLKKICSILEPSGWLIMNIPNPHSIDRRLFGPHWMGFDPPRHLYVFPTDTLWDMLHKAGLEPRNWKSFLPSYFSFAISLERWAAPRSPGLAKFIGRISTFPGLRFIFEPYFALANRFLLSGLITVFAQKPPLEKHHETT
jgi:SAM-dependent methyltransferase